MNRLQSIRISIPTGLLFFIISLLLHCTVIIISSISRSRERTQTHQPAPVIMAPLKQHAALRGSSQFGNPNGAVHSQPTPAVSPAPKDTQPPQEHTQPTNTKQEHSARTPARTAQQPQQELRTTKSLQNTARTNTAAPQKLTLAALARGFIASQGAHDGPDGITRAGDPNKRPDLEELKTLSYLKKIAWYLQSSWRTKNYPLEKDPRAIRRLIVALSLDHDGIITDLTTEQSSGSIIADDKIVQGIRNAAPFPPIPQHLRTKPFVYRFSVEADGPPQYLEWVTV